MDLAHPLALLAFTGPNIPVWSQYVHLLVLALDGLATVFHSAGLAIIAFTIIVKTIMLPLTVKSIRSSKAMQDLQPKIKELQKKHGNDRQRVSQETMALYQQYQVNPMAGCLPMIIQIPIFLGLYQSITTLSNTGTGYWDQGFLWLPSLDHPDPWKILPIAAGIFQFVQTQMMRPKDQQKSTDPQQAMMNSVMNIMPLTVVFFGWSFAAGPVLYWCASAGTPSVQHVVRPDDHQLEAPPSTASSRCRSGSGTGRRQDAGSAHHCAGRLMAVPGILSGSWAAARCTGLNIFAQWAWRLRSAAMCLSSLPCTGATKPTRKCGRWSRTQARA
mgnify:CR=1 FL=1